VNNQQQQRRAIPPAAVPNSASTRVQNQTNVPSGLSRERQPHPARPVTAETEFGDMDESFLNDIELDATADAYSARSSPSHQIVSDAQNVNQNQPNQQNMHNRNQSTSNIPANAQQRPGMAPNNHRPTNAQNRQQSIVNQNVAPQQPEYNQQQQNRRPPPVARPQIVNANAQQPPARTFTIDQSRSAPVTNAQVRSSRPSTVQGGTLPSLNVGSSNRAQSVAEPAPDIAQLAAIGAKAAPELGSFGGGFASARGVKRVSDV